jgi:drug/metabolite transporter (DMT)-like permease
LCKIDIMRERPSGFANPWLQLGLNIICVVLYELLLKTGAKATADLSRSWWWTGITGLTSPLIWLAIVVIILDLMVWLYVLKYIPLSIAFPLSRVVDVLVPICCWLILKEEISPLRWCGIALVIIGLAIVAKPAARLEERL